MKAKPPLQPKPKKHSHQKLFGLSNPELSALLVREYIEQNDPRALSLLREAWPHIDWDEVIGHFREVHYGRSGEPITIAE